MGKRWRVPSDLHLDAIAVVRATLADRPTLTTILDQRQHLVTGELEYGVDETLPFVAYGEVAKQISAMPSGSIVWCRGSIRNHVWKTGNTTRDKLVLEVHRIEVTGRSEER